MTPTSHEPGADFWGNLDRRIQAEWLLVTLALLSLTFALAWYGAPLGLARLDHAFYDKTLAASVRGVHDDRIVIVAIDDGSIEKLGYWPWRRALHARLLDRLRHARVVGLDIVFSDLNPSYPDDDDLLARAIARHGRVVLPLVVDGPRKTAAPPLPPLSRAAAAKGYINVYPDEDGVIRSLTLRQALADGTPVDHFVPAMLAVAGQPVEYGKRAGDRRLIPYAGAPGHFRLYPYSEVLSGAIPEEVFRDKHVIVGSWASGLGDAFPTPLSHDGEAMSGVEILANGLQAAMNDSWIAEPARWQAAILACLPVLLACAALRRLSPSKAFLASLAVLLLIFTGSWLALRFGQLWVPFTASLVGVALAYPVWGWRSQEAALQHIDRELNALNQERRRLDGGLPARSKRYGRTLSARISLLHDTVAQLRRARSNREETLRFLSHDMRAPQNSILALTELQSHPDSALPQDELLRRINSCAHKTLILVDGFVQLARAEAASMRRHPVNLVELVTQSCESYWASARNKNISIEFHDTPDEAWTRGDGVLLQRAWDNLLDNALKYSPPDTAIHCGIRAKGASWELSIRDHGRGMTDAQRQALFRPFIRFDEDSAGNPAGAGLGLAFVKTVIERHEGAIAVAAAAGGGTLFTVTLPGDPDAPEGPAAQASA